VTCWFLQTANCIARPPRSALMAGGSVLRLETSPPDSVSNAALPGECPFPSARDQHEAPPRISPASGAFPPLAAGPIRWAKSAWPAMFAGAIAQDSQNAAAGLVPPRRHAVTIPGHRDYRSLISMAASASVTIAARTQDGNFGHDLTSLVRIRRHSAYSSVAECPS
jgi:hypothetical protein